MVTNALLLLLIISLLIKREVPMSRLQGSLQSSTIKWNFDMLFTITAGRKCYHLIHKTVADSWLTVSILPIFHPKRIQFCSRVKTLGSPCYPWGSKWPLWHSSSQWAVSWEFGDKNQLFHMSLAPFFTSFLFHSFLECGCETRCGRPSDAH